MADEFSFSVDSDWKKQAQEEKRRLAEEAERKRAAAAAAPASGTAPAGGAAGVQGGNLGGNLGGAAAATAPAGAARRGRRARGELPEPSFETLVQTLASQALVYLGGVAMADGQGMLDLDTAKHQIDLLGVLEEKTQGNLSDDEQKLLDVTLYETRMRYVSVASRYIL